MTTVIIASASSGVAGGMPGQRLRTGLEYLRCALAFQSLVMVPGKFPEFPGLGRLADCPRSGEPVGDGVGQTCCSAQVDRAQHPHPGAARAVEDRAGGSAQRGVHGHALRAAAGHQPGGQPALQGQSGYVRCPSREPGQPAGRVHRLVLGRPYGRRRRVESLQEGLLGRRHIRPRSGSVALLVAVEGGDEVRHHSYAAGAVGDLVSEGQHDEAASLRGNQYSPHEWAGLRGDGARLFTGDDRLPGRSLGGGLDADRALCPAVPGLGGSAVDRDAEQRVLCLHLPQRPRQRLLTDLAVDLGDQGELDRVSVHVEIDGPLEGSEAPHRLGTRAADRHEAPYSLR
nr:hypothetical protein [Streptomyces sp. CHB19.2]